MHCVNLKEYLFSYSGGVWTCYLCCQCSINFIENWTQLYLLNQDYLHRIFFPPSPLSLINFECMVITANLIKQQNLRLCLFFVTIATTFRLFESYFDLPVLTICARIIDMIDKKVIIGYYFKYWYCQTELNPSKFTIYTCTL